MSTKHTPGPWQHNHLDFLQICDSDGVVRGCSPIARVAGGKNGETRAEARANARLIAAAPDLLAALQGWCAHLDGEPCGPDDTPEHEDALLNAMRAAIAKATGSSS